MDEFSVVLRARTFVRETGSFGLPPSVEAYVQQIGGVLRHEADLPDDEPGYSFESNGKHFVCVNEKDSEERRRSTACHEIAHIVLGLPSDHSSMPWWSYAKRPKNGVLCDVFAAELLLPKQLFEPLVREEQIGLSAIDKLGRRFLASATATGSRYAMVMDAPCAFILSENGVVRYASRSKTLRDAGGWIPPRMEVPPGTLSAGLRAGSMETAPDEVAADVWFSDWRRGGLVLEEARYLKSWDQTLTLLWFEDEEVPSLPRDTSDTEDENPLLRELDGTLPWPGKRRRR